MSEQKIRLARIYIEQSDISRIQGDLKTTIEACTKAIEIYKEMAQEDPACWSLVADTIERVGASYKAAGELEKASEALSEAAVLRLAIIKNAQEQGD